MTFQHHPKTITKRFYYSDKNFSEYTIKYNGYYDIHDNYPNGNDSFTAVDNPDEWINCPYCKLKPLVWAFNNGWYTQCGCFINKYFYFCISATPLMHQTEPLNFNLLRDNWNDWAINGNRLNVSGNQDIIRNIVYDRENIEMRIDKDLLGDDFDPTIYKSLID